MTDAPQFSTQELQALQTCLEQMLIQHPQGIGEFELLKQLQQQQQKGFPQVSLTQPLALFQMHFLLFHILYQLRAQLWLEQRGHLDISALKICLRVYQPSEAGLDQYDPVADYYLQLDHLYTTTEANVQERLNWFWTKFAACDDKQQALQTLGLEEPVTYTEIKYRYRQLAAQHHPDRGGDKTKFQSIQQAMDVLDRYFS